MGAAVGIFVIVLAPFIANDWINADQLSPTTIQQALMIMGLVVASQWPLSFYVGGLMGLQRQVLLNAISAGMATLRSLGAILILWLISPTIQAFFCWQIVTGILETLLTAFYLWRSLPASNQKPRFRKESLLTVWRFAAGMSGISIVSLILTQLDKIVLSKLLTLEMFGYYSLAIVVANSLLRLTGPLFSALFPSFSKLVALGDQETLKDLYHQSCQLMSVAILPAAVVVSLFSAEILLLWTKSPVTVENTHRLVSLLIIGTALNGLVNLPFALQLAHGWTTLSFYKNVVAVIILAPMIVFLAINYGPVGAATAWIILNSGYVLIEIPIMHRRLLRGEMQHWYLADVGLPLAAVMAVGLLGRWLIREPIPPLAMLVSLGAVWVVAASAAVVAAPQLRSWLRRRIGWVKMVYDGA